MGDKAELWAQLNAQFAANSALKDERWNLLLNSVNQNKLDQLDDQIKASDESIAELLQRIKNSQPVTVIKQPSPVNDLKKVQIVQSPESIISPVISESISPKILQVKQSCDNSNIHMHNDTYLGDNDPNILQVKQSCDKNNDHHMNNNTYLGDNDPNSMQSNSPVNRIMFII